MKIVFEHSTPLPVKKYGGTERILFWLMKELVNRGHEVSLIGHPESDLKDTGIRLIDRTQAENWQNLIPKSTDLVHLFSNPLPHPDSASLTSSTAPVPRLPEQPILITIEGNGRPGEVFHENTVFISKNHAKRHGANVYVYNGIDLLEYPFRPKKLKWETFLFLAKAKWKVKNLKQTVRAVRATHKTLHIAGGSHWLGNPLLRSLTNIYAHGMVDQTEKLKLLNQCDALCFPVRWHEPFGIAIIEAMALGLPVLGSPYGSLPELISPQTGQICQNYEAFEAALRGAPSSYESVTIREYVEKKFSATVMTERYLELYQKILSGERLHQTQPKTLSQDSAEQLLAF